MTRDEFFNTPCTLFDCCASNKGRLSTFGDFLCDESQITLIGDLRRSADIENQRTIKTHKLKAATLSAVFPSGERGKDKPHQLTGYICVDIDAQDNPNVSPAQMKELASGCKQVAWCAHSSRGKGVYALIRLAQPHRFEAHFKALQRLFKERMGLVIDPSCNSFERLRIASFDDRPHFNGDAEPFAIVDEDGDESTEEPAEAEEIPQAYASAEAATDTIARVETLVSEIEARGMDLCPTRDEWVECAMELHCLGADGKGFFERISALWQAKAGRTTSQQAIDNLWRSIKRTGTTGTTGTTGKVRTIASFFARCAAHGLNIPHKQQSFEEIFGDIL